MQYNISRWNTYQIYSSSTLPPDYDMWMIYTHAAGSQEIWKSDNTPVSCHIGRCPLSVVIHFPNWTHFRVVRNAKDIDELSLHQRVWWMCIFVTYKFALLLTLGWSSVVFALCLLIKKIYHPVNRLRSTLSSCHPVIWSFGHLVTRSLGHSVTWSLGHSVWPLVE